MPAGPPTEVIRSRISLPPQKEPAAADPNPSLILDPPCRNPPANHIAATDRRRHTESYLRARVRSPPPALSGRWRGGRGSSPPRPTQRLECSRPSCLRGIG